MCKRQIGLCTHDPSVCTWHFVKKCVNVREKIGGKRAKNNICRENNSKDKTKNDFDEIAVFLFAAVDVILKFSCLKFKMIMIKKIKDCMKMS